jgi:hypothetical protein
MHSFRDWLMKFTAWQRLALLTWSIIALLAVGRAVLIAHPRHGGCYHLFAEAGRQWLAGEDLYTPQISLDVFRYSPLVGAFFAPFGILPDLLGSACLRLVNVTVYIVGFGWWLRVGVPARLTPGQRAALWLLAVPLSAHSLVDVQTNALTVGLLLLAVTAAAQELWGWTAALLLLACSIKAYPFALVLLLVAVFPRRLAARIALATVAVLALPFLLQTPAYVFEQYADWLRWGLNDRHSDGVVHAFRDFRLLCRVWIAPLSDHGYLIAQLAAAAVIAGLCVLQRWRNIEPRRLLATLFGLGCAWMMVFGPATEHTTHIFLAPVLAWAVLDGWLSHRSLLYRTTTLTSFCLFTATQLCLWLPGGARFFQLAPHPIAGLLLMAALAVAALWECQEQTRAELQKASASLRQAA